MHNTAQEDNEKQDLFALLQEERSKHGQHTDRKEKEDQWAIVSEELQDEQNKHKQDTIQDDKKKPCEHEQGGEPGRQQQLGHVSGCWI